jgi:hypothetical protein
MTRVRVARFACGLAWWVFVASFCVSAALDNTYVDQPRVAQAEIGRVNPYRVKGVTVYTTSGERAVIDWLTWTEVAAGAIVVATVLIGGPRNMITNLRR